MPTGQNRCASNFSDNQKKVVFLLIPSAWPPADRLAVLATLPFPAGEATRLRVQVERGRETTPLPLHRADHQPQLPGAGRADQRPGYPHLEYPGGVPRRFQGVPHRDIARPLFHG